jgi:hypothetical protein
LPQLLITDVVVAGESDFPDIWKGSFLVCPCTFNLSMRRKSTEENKGDKSTGF